VEERLAKKNHHGSSSLPSDEPGEEGESTVEMIMA
jgi:hypothetical protein